MEERVSRGFLESGAAAKMYMFIRIINTIALSAQVIAFIFNSKTQIKSNQIKSNQNQSPIKAPINTAALSAAIIMPICGLTVNGSTMDASTTFRFAIPMTVVFASTHCPIRHELDQWLTSPSVYADGVVM